MAFSKYKSPRKKKKNPESHMSVNNLRKENANLKNILVELSRQHSEHNKLLERFLSLETIRMESSQQPTAKDEKITLPSEQLSKKEGNLMDAVSMRSERRISSREIEEIKNKLVGVSTRCQYLENKVAAKKDCTSNEQLSTSNVTELQNHLRDALEKNKQWLEYDQQREAYLKAILARMLWLEKQLNEANQARSQQHNKDHSDEKDRISQMQEHYERLLQKAKDQREVLREQVDMTHQDLIRTQNWCKERERQVDELKQQLQTHHHYSEDEEQQLRDETKDLLGKLDEERRRSTNFELQAHLFQKFMVNRHHVDQEKIADLERQIKISSHDLEDERQNCSYLKKQMVRVLKTLQKSKDHRDQQDHSSCEVTHPPHQPTGDNLTSSPPSSLLNESFLECPGCRAEYPASHYRDLMNHLEICLD